MIWGDVEHELFWEHFEYQLKHDKPIYKEDISKVIAHYPLVTERGNWTEVRDKFNNYRRTLKKIMKKANTVKRPDCFVPRYKYSGFVR
jgi:hypothetical protein